MPTFDELARSYAVRLARSAQPQIEAQRIALEIRGLVASSTQAPLSSYDKQQILQSTYNYLQGIPYYTKSLDNQQYLQLIEWIMSQAN